MKLKLIDAVGFLALAFSSRAYGGCISPAAQSIVDDFRITQVESVPIHCSKNGRSNSQKSSIPWKKLTLVSNQIEYVAVIKSTDQNLKAGSERGLRIEKIECDDSDSTVSCGARRDRSSKIMQKYAAALVCKNGEAWLAVEMKNDLVPRAVPISDVISYWDRATREYPDEHRFKTVRDLLILGRDKLKMRGLLSIKGRAADNCDYSLIEVFLGTEFYRALECQQGWPARFDQREKKALLGRLNEYQTYLKGSPFVSAWLQFQAGKKDEARKYLETRFTEQYSQFMKLTSSVYVPSWVRPLGDEEDVYFALRATIEPKDRPNLDKRMNEIREHLKTIGTTTQSAWILEPTMGKVNCNDYR